jgi:uncharacterized membrane protein YiaA
MTSIIVAGCLENKSCRLQRSGYREIISTKCEVFEEIFGFLRKKPLQTLHMTKPLVRALAEDGLGLNFNKRNENEVGLTNQNTLRKLVGILGMLLPVVLFFSIDEARPLASISHYYYTRWSSVFVITVSLLAIFLIVYKGPELIDFYLSTLAGLFALCVILFPTYNLSDVCCDATVKYSITFLEENDLRVKFHFTSAAVFLLCLAFMSFFLFTKSDKSVEERPKEKQIRNRIFRICSVIMVLAMAVIVAGAIGFMNADFYNEQHLTFWMEAVAVESFGFSWLIKGGSFKKVINLLSKQERGAF